jgi:putative DNA primase/helicase
LGASLRGRNSLTAIELWHGAGANGKSVLSNLIQKALGLTKDGGYAATVDAGVILSSYKQRDAEASTPFRMQLIGARLVFMSETTDTAHLNEAFLKQITGGDLLPARGNYQSGGTYDVTFSPILLTNNLPNIAEGGKALWDRLAPFKFNVRWRRPNKLIVDACETALPKGDSWFETHAPKLEEILQYTLWWLVQGGVDWERNGLGEAPADVLDGVRQYMSDQDKLEEWMAEDGWILDPAGRTTASAVFTSYAEWCKKTGSASPQQRIFSKRLYERYPELTSGKSDGSRVIKGITRMNTLKC